MLLPLIIWHTFWGLLGSTANILLIYLALFKSPKMIHCYATLIVNFALTDLIECLSDFLVENRVLPVPGSPAMVHVCYGMCKYLGSFSCKLALSFFMHCVSHSVWSLLLSFGYRYYVLHYPSVPRRKLFCVILLVYSPSLFQAIIYWPNLVDSNIVVPLADEWFPQYNLSAEHAMVVGIIDATTWSAVFTIAHICLPIFPVYIAIFILRRRILTYLGEKRAIMSRETNATHSQLLKVLTIQAIIPMFSGVGIIAYMMMQTGIAFWSILQYTVFGSIVIMPAVSPLTYLYFVRPYREWISRAVFKTKVTGQLGSRTDHFESTDARINNKSLPPLRVDTNTK